MKLKGFSGGTEFVTGLDIGTSSIKVAVAERHGRRPTIVHVHKEPCFGMRKGAIIDLSEASQSINRALSEVKKISKSAARNIYISIGTPQVKMQASRGIVAVSRADAEIYQDDIDRAVRASQAVNLPQNRTIIHTLTKEYVVDGVGDIADPLGLSGSRLEVQSLIIDAFSPHIKSLMRAVELAGGEIGGLVFGPLVAARAALSKRQKDLGTAIIDVGFGTTGMAVYEENRLAGTGKFPVGASNISNDLAVGLKISVDAAEEVKLHYGYALSKEVGAKESVDLKKFSDDAKNAASRRFIAEIVESRLEEILDLANAELKLLQKFGELPGGVVLVGGGAKLPGLTDLVRQEMRLSAQIGCTLAESWEGEGGAFKEYLEDPEYVNAFGLVLWGMSGEGGGDIPESKESGIRNFFRYFTP
ncbi:MAG TPA: cell division protein FtsA [Candidatus Paceibacterota bacterium]|nr:cell division protein FtsA [Candidatus Paceibacterota bacterium]